MLAVNNVNHPQSCNPSLVSIPVHLSSIKRVECESIAMSLKDGRLKLAFTWSCICLARFLVISPWYSICLASSGLHDMSFSSAPSSLHGVSLGVHEVSTLASFGLLDAANGLLDRGVASRVVMSLASSLLEKKSSSTLLIESTGIDWRR